MFSITIRRGLLAVFTALLVVATTATVASTVVNASEMCTGNGGRWKGGGTSGTCYFNLNSPYTLDSCSPGEVLRTDWVDNALDSTSCLYYANHTSGAHSESECWFIGGTWESEPGVSATCTVTHTMIGDCPGTTIYSFNLASPYPYEKTITCSALETEEETKGGGYTAPPKPRIPGHGNFGNGITSDGSGSANLGGGKNGLFYYNEGTCAGSCSVGANIPKGAKNSKPSGTQATLYVRMVDSDGNPSNGSYSVCFDPGKLDAPVIYRFVSGAWVAQPVYNSGGLVCTTASGDGAFALAK
ncbi:MAG: hypothetical protein EPO32_04545 [Anaerolineae bacterium]|nr:MAG: hypothetical protein EPO32_04545 [Anaerolineae bacterium]